MNTATYPQIDKAASRNDDLPDLVRKSHPFVSRFAVVGESQNNISDSTEDLRKGFPQPARVVPKYVQAGLPQQHFQPLQQWEGVVTEFDAHSVSVELKDLTNPEHPVEFADLPIADFAIEDRQLLEPGCVLYWSIGYRRSPGGTIERVSVVRPRRTPLWSSREVEAITVKAQDFLNQMTRHDAIVSTAD